MISEVLKISYKKGEMGIVPQMDIKLSVRLKVRSRDRANVFIEGRATN